jgi:hypothetical protein
LPFAKPEEDVPQNGCKAPSHALRHALWDSWRVGQDAPHEASWQQTTGVQNPKSDVNQQVLENVTHSELTASSHQSIHEIEGVNAVCDVHDARVIRRQFGFFEVEQRENAQAREGDQKCNAEGKNQSCHVGILSFFSGGVHGLKITTRALIFDFSRIPVPDVFFGCIKMRAVQLPRAKNNAFSTQINCLQDKVLWGIILFQAKSSLNSTHSSLEIETRADFLSVQTI